MRQRAIILIAAIMLAIVSGMPGAAYAQDATPAPLPAANTALVYNGKTITLLNLSQTNLSLNGMVFWRAGGEVKYKATTLASVLKPGQCAQLWTAEVKQQLDKSPECGQRLRWQKLGRPDTYFWIGESDNEFFRPQFGGTTLTLCPASRGDVLRCEFHIPQDGNMPQFPTLNDPATGLPMPAGMQVAYDNNQLWIGNLTPDTALPTRSLRIFYSINKQEIEWAPDTATWDIGKWEGRGLLPNQCIVLYKDASKVTPLLPCAPIARTVVNDPIWQMKFEVLGPREDRRSLCGSDTPASGPVLCLISG
jgi:hypothetical protein